MTDEEFRSILHAELAPIRAELAPIRAELASMRPHIDGIPLLANAIEVLQRDLRAVRDDMRVSSAMTMRLDGSLSALLPEIHGMHRQIANLSDRIRKLEDAEH